MADIVPFKLSVPDADIERLQSRLANSHYPDELDGSGWDLGAPLADVKRLGEYWQKEFNWRKAEARINELPQFTTTVEVDGFEPLKIHFMFQKSSVESAVPLLFLHGWPGSFIESQKLLPLLSAGDGKESAAFHVVAPSLPNFGFSDGVKKRGFGLSEYAETCHKLMLKLGFSQYATQGGDWGMYISRIQGLRFPESCRASHINLIRSQPPSFTKQPLLAIQHAFSRYSPGDRQGFARTKWFTDEGSGYRLLQSTKPQTLGYAMADSPIGLLAWIYEKLHDWTDDYYWTDDELLTWVSIYQFSSAGPAASLRIYYEATHPSGPGGLHRAITERWVPRVKLGLARFPRELSVVPRSYMDTLGSVVYFSDNPHGGHFAATEHPEVIARDLAKMFGRGGPVFGIIDGHSGYSD